ncbi:putative protein N(5)-glutamine methyltransferase [Planomonospora corallina]|uniref:Release factor glutamine methyltransferase n=1 Tax=Planomonospora corallina TaxID=1806052 RepID=A0ABV8IAA4_9ACTN
MTSPLPVSPSAVVARLRAAGCVFAEDEADLIISTARTAADLAAMVDRRAAGLPLEHVLGWAEFCGLRVAVEPGVFVPRRRTEFLARQAAALALRAAGAAPGLPGPVSALAGAAPGLPGPAPGSPRGASPRPPAVVVDLCCGSGAVGAALAAALDRAESQLPERAGPRDRTGFPASGASPARIELHAVDIDPAAVRCARRNLAAAGGLVYEGDLYAPLPAALRGRVGLLVASTPYVPSEEIGLLPAEARVHEPRLALDGGADGLDVVRRVAAEAPGWLAPGGSLLVETGRHQAERAAGILARSGLVPEVAVSDELDATVVIGTAAPSGPGLPRP